MEEWWFRFVGSGVLRRLEDIAGKAAGERGPLAEEAALLVAAWRALLRMHEQAPGGRCALCRRARSPGAVCSVWQVAIAYFVRRLPGEEGGSG